MLLPVIGFYYLFSNKEPVSNEHNFDDGVYTSSNSGNKNKSVLSRVIFVSDIENDYVSLENFIKTANDYSVDAVFVLGDITSFGVYEEMEKSKNLFDTLNMSAYYIPGDRDLWKSDGLDAFNEVFGESYGLVEIKGVNYLLIDNSDEFSGVDNVQMEYIENNLEFADFVLVHNPIYFDKSLLGLLRKGMGQYSSDVENQRIYLLDLVRGSNSVRSTFAGDQHYFNVSDDSKDNNLIHVVAGSLNSNRSMDSPNFVLLTLYEDSEFEVEKINLPFEID